MSRYRVVDAVNALLGTSSHRGDLVRVSESGVRTNRVDRDIPDREPDVEPCTPYRHGKLRGVRRCFGCGRTKNEIELEGGR